MTNTIPSAPATGTNNRLAHCAWAVGGYALLIGALTGVIYVEDGRLTIPLVIFCLLGLALASFILATRKTWTAWLAVAYSAATLAGDAPHQVPELIHPTAASRVVGAAVLLATGVGALVVSLAARPRRSQTTRRTARRTQHAGATHPSTLDHGVDDTG